MTLHSRESQAFGSQVRNLGYAQGTGGDGIVVPLMPGDHEFEVKRLEQPPIFRNWQAWE